jgi:hypothetical protein
MQITFTTEPEDEENFDLSLISSLETDVIPCLGGDRVPDYLITQLAKVLQQGSQLLLNESDDDEHPPTPTSLTIRDAKPAARGDKADAKEWAAQRCRSTPASYVTRDTALATATEARWTTCLRYPSAVMDIRHRTPLTHPALHIATLHARYHLPIRTHNHRPRAHTHRIHTNLLWHLPPSRRSLQAS